MAYSAKRTEAQNTDNDSELSVTADGKVIEANRQDYIRGYDRGVEDGVKEKTEDLLYDNFRSSLDNAVIYLRQITDLKHPNYHSFDFNILYGQLLACQKLSDCLLYTSPSPRD